MIYKRGKTYWYKFMWQGKLIRESTKQGNDRLARNMESAHRTHLGDEDFYRSVVHLVQCERPDIWIDPFGQG
jgi:hypothetical protein